MSPSLTRMFARTRDSLTVSGPTLVTPIFVMWICAKSDGAKARKRMKKKTWRIREWRAGTARPTFQSRVGRAVLSPPRETTLLAGHVVVGDFGGVFKSGDGF